MTFKQACGGAVLSLGRIYCDLIFPGLPAMSRLGREVFADGMTLSLGGGAFITAAHSAAHGRTTALVARFGTDALSAAMEPQLAMQGIDLRFLDRHPYAGPQVTVAMIKGEERAFLSRRAGKAEPATLEAALAWPEARHLHIAEYATLVEMPGIVERAKARGLTVSLDPSWDDDLIRDPQFLDRCAGIDVFLPNLEEASIVAGTAEPRRAIKFLAEHFPVLALKLGADGGMLSMGQEILALPAPQVGVVDTTGAGDAFNAGFLDAWLDGRPAGECLSAAIEAGSRSVQAAGGAAVLAR